MLGCSLHPQALASAARANLRSYNKEGGRLIDQLHNNSQRAA
jgi:hypothetical protein